MEPVLTERECLADLKRLLDKAREYETSIVVMGGWAVSAYVGRHRFTKDIDLLVAKKGIGYLKAAMKELGYITQKSRFGFQGRKSSDQVDVKLDVAVETILDESRGDQDFVYVPGPDTWNNAPVRRISAYHSENQPNEFQAAILPLLDLLIAKIMPVNRIHDMLDVASLILRRTDLINPLSLAKGVKGQELEFVVEFRRRLEDLAGYYRGPEFDGEWRLQLGRRLSRVDVEKLLGFLRSLNRSL